MSELAATQWSFAISSKSMTSLAIDITREKAEAYLTDKVTGDYICRNSETQTDAPRITIKTDKGVKHVKLHVKTTEQGAVYRMTDKMSFNSLQELINYYSAHKFLADEERVALHRYMIPDKDSAKHFNQRHYEEELKLAELPWYYGVLTRSQTESIFKSANFDVGIYMLRKKDGGEIGKNYILSFINKIGQFRSRSVSFDCLIIESGLIHLDHMVLYQYFHFKDDKVVITYGLSRRKV